MTQHAGDEDPGSFWHRRRHGIRYLYSAAAAAGGILLAVRYASSDGPDGEWMLVCALVLIGLGVVSVPLFWWMDKRGL
ncbi:hypothetical protein [Agrococcus sp. Marseille-P2731]|uniref:hypothetical protein n=1 Tax=Agrococcus sp. Marseille-P2731 TaxID=1841862 RepID=UPI000930CB9E|nr:hypothetical protein [Agrococcus sp. Marseille-P2731]